MVPRRDSPGLDSFSEEGEAGRLLGQLRRAGEKPSRELIDRLKAHGPAVVPGLIAMAVDPGLLEIEDDRPEAWAPLHAVELLGEIGASEAAAPLVSLLDYFDYDRLADSAVYALGATGPSAIGLLREVFFDRSKNLYTRSRAGGALAEIGKRHPETRAEAIAILSGRLDPAETREPDDETLNGFAIGDLLQLKAKEASTEILRAFAEDRVDTSVVDRDYVLEQLDLPHERADVRPQKGFEIRLVCTACRYERPHNVEVVYYDPGVVERRKRGAAEPYSEYIIPQPITCPKCRAVDQYEVSTLSLAMLSLDLLSAGKQLEARRGGKHGRKDRTSVPGESSRSRVKVRRFGLEDGRPMHPLAGRDMYRAQVEAEPSRADLRLRYGKVLRFLGHYEEALEQCGAAARLNPTDLETLLTMGMIARDAGQPDEARRWLERIVRQVAQAGGPSSEAAEYARNAIEELRDLDRVATPGGPAVERVTGAPSRLPDFPLDTPKVGRNDPCPCGSGKKYKKCHGR